MLLLPSMSENGGVTHGEPIDQLPLFERAPEPVRAAPRPRLVVVRDRGRLWERHGEPGARLWTLKELFDRVRLLAFDDDLEGVRDDDGALWAAASVLSRASAFAVRVAPDLRALYRALVHGGVTPGEVARALAGEEGRPGDLAQIFAQVADVEGRLGEEGFIDGAEALARGVRALEEGRLPPSLAAFSSIEVEHPVDPSELEVRALVALGRVGVPLEVVLPLDEGRRGLGEGVVWIADALEKAHDAPQLELRFEGIGGRGPLRHFVDAWYAPQLTPPKEAPVRVEVAPDQGEEARRIAGVVARWRRTASPPPRIAVAVRTLDLHAERLADSLESYGVPVRRRRGRALVEAAPARALLDLLRVRREGAPRDLLLAVLASPSFAGGLPPEDVGALSRLLRQAVARTDVEDATRPRGGYAHRLERFASSVEERDPEAAAAARVAVERVQRVLAIADPIPERATLAAFVERAFEIVDASLVEDIRGERALLREHLARWWQVIQRVSRAGDAEVDLAAFSRLLSRALAEVHLPPPVVEDDTAVELLSLPELFGRSFDYVVIAGCVHGRLPLAERLDPLLSDGDRKLVNQRMGRRVLRLFDPDLVEPGPVPRRQALELLWFAGAASAARRGLFITAAARDARGRDQAPSVFLQKALVALGRDPEDASAGVAFDDEPPRRWVRLVAAQAAVEGRLDASASTILDERARGHVTLFARMAEERRRFFARPAEAPLSEYRAPFAFAVDPARFLERFGRQLGLHPDKPLGPTRLEAIAACRMRGFIEHLLGVDTWPFPGQDGDARLLGRVAHEVLEEFFRERRDQRVPPARMTDDDRARLLAILAARATRFVEREAPGHQAALRANIEWLGRTLVRTVTQLARNPPVPGAAPAYFELKVGTRGWQETKEALGPVPLRIGERELFFGGEIDRVDEGPGARVVVDYKNSTAAAVIDKLRASAVLKTHFQLPLYLRLLEHHRPTEPRTHLEAYLVSLREGVASRVLGREGELRRRILDDEREDGLARGIERVLAPLFEGTVVPDDGGHCKACRLARICRVPHSGGGRISDVPYEAPAEGDDRTLLVELLTRVGED